MARHLASPLERATVGCFFACLEIQLKPRNMYPLGERQVSGHTAQPTPEKP